MRHLLLFIFGILFLVIVSFFVVHAVFQSDITSSNSYYEAIMYVREKNIIRNFRDGTFRPYHTVTRGEFGRILIRMNFLKKGLLKGFPDRIFQAARELTLAEAATILTKAFDIEMPTPSELLYTYLEVSPEYPEGKLMYKEPPWYKGSLVALERKNAIPTSFFAFNEKVTRAELAEMIFRLKEDITIWPSRTYEELERFQYGDKQEFMRLFGNFQKETVPATLLSTEQTAQFSEPASYAWYELDDIESDAYCRWYVTDAVSVTESQQTLQIQLEGKSADYCKILDPDIDPKICRQSTAGISCSCKLLPSGTESCRRMGQKAHTISLVKEHNQIKIEGAESNRLKILRRSIEKLPFEWGTDGPFYDHTRIDTKGLLAVNTLQDGRILSIYRTKWQPILRDLRGVPYLMVEKTLSHGSVFRKIYYSPEHNRNPYGKGFASYERCLENSLSPAKNYFFQFCIKKEGSDFVVASYLELGDRMTLWIDEHFKR